MSAHKIARTVLVGSVALILVAPAGVATAVTTPETPTTLACDGTWHIVNTPFDPSLERVFTAVTATAANNAWAVGNERTPGVDAQRPLIEHWDGTTWKKVKAPMPTDANVASLTAVSARTARDAWAVGSYQIAGGAKRALVEHWNGKRWKIISSGILGVDIDPAAVTAISANDVWLAGKKGSSVWTTFTAHWDGTKWKAVPSPNQPDSVDNFLYGLSATSANDVWTTGSWTSSGWSYGMTQHWNGASWKIIKSKSAFNLPGVAAIGPNDAWVAGIDAAGDGVTTQHWNGSRWSLGDAPPGSSVHVGGMAAAASDDIWIFGDTSPGRILTEHWDGASWSIIASETPAILTLNVGGVAVAPDGSVAFGVATYISAEGGGPRTLALRWC